MEVTETVPKSFPGIRSTAASSLTSSESSSESDSDCDSITWKRKKPVPRSNKLEASRPEPHRDGRILTARRNNVWSNVIAEQSLTQGVSMTCSVEGEDLHKCERDVESYSYRKPGLDGNDADVSQLFQNRRFKKHDNKNFEEGNGSVKDRLGSHSIVVKQPLVVDFNEDDDEDIVINGIAKYLNEPKLDLIGRVVKFLGKPKAMQLLHLTDEMENMGGILTKDGSRRRTPGGVFLYLLRIDKDVTNSMRGKIFEEERRITNRLEAQVRKQEMKRRNRKRAKMDIDDDSSSLPPLTSRMELEYEKVLQANVQEEDDVSEPAQASSSSPTPEPHAEDEDNGGRTTTPEPGHVLPRVSRAITDSDREDGQLSDSD